ncbi:MAG: rhomboid family intramembrane serine protease [Proteobacteria bacterium]|nr:rhomboid family intramembrane serine protease [Pseudomonadota bacterium]
MTYTKKHSSWKDQLVFSLIVLGGLVAAMWVLEIVDQFILGGALNQYGIRPRDTDRLSGILFAPFLHGDFAHLSSNTIPFLVLGWFILLRGRAAFLVATLVAVIIGGAGTWLIGASSSVHIGASGVVFGYLGFLLGGGIFDRSIGTIILALISAVLYGGIIFGVLPGQVGISWQGHLFGFIGGVLAAKLFAGSRSKEKTA